MNSFDDHVTEVDGLNIEHREDQVSLYGSIDIRRSKTGLEKARRIALELQQVVGFLEAEERKGSLPDDLSDLPREMVANPFA